MMVRYDSFDYEEHNSFGPQILPSLDINDVLEEGERDAEEGLKFISNYAKSPSFQCPESICTLENGALSNFAFEICSNQNSVPITFESSLQAHLKKSLRDTVKETNKVIMNNETAQKKTLES